MWKIFTFAVITFKDNVYLVYTKSFAILMEYIPYGLRCYHYSNSSFNRL